MLRIAAEVLMVLMMTVMIMDAHGHDADGSVGSSEVVPVGLLVLPAGWR